MSMPNKSDGDSAVFRENIEYIYGIFKQTSIFIYRKINQFTYARIGPENVLLIFLILLTTILVGGKTMVIVGPFSGLSLSWAFIISLIALTVGHYFAGILTRDGRWRWSIYHLPLCLIFFYILLAIQAINLDRSFSEFRLFIGYLTILQLSLLGGILSGAMGSAPWLGHALFLRQIKPSLKKGNYHYLYWDEEGEIHLYKPDEIEPWWNEKTRIVDTNINNKTIPFNHFAPVRVDEGEIRKISPVQSEVDEIFTNIPVAWSDAMKHYKTAIEDGYERISWLVLFQLIIPIHASSLAAQNSKIPGRLQRVEIDDETFSLDWPIVQQSWEGVRRELFSNDINDSVLHIALNSDEKPEDVLAVELKILGFDSKNKEKVLIGAYALRSYTHLMLMLFEYLSIDISSRSEISKRCIRSISSWYIGFIRSDFITEISRYAKLSEGRISSEVISLNDWTNIFSEAFVEPSTVFLNLHDQLGNFISDSKSETDDLNGSIMNLILSCTEQVIVLGSRKPVTTSLKSEQLQLGRKRELGLSRKATLLTGICKMQIIKSLLHHHEEGLS